MKENTFYQNLFAAKKEIGKISKDSTNPFFKSKYFDINSLLEHVEPILHKHGLFILQPIEAWFVCSQIVEENGFLTNSCIELPDIKDPQKLGSAITYYRRYTLQSLLALQAEDDDANGATKQVKQEAKPTLKVNRPNSDVPTPQWHNVLQGIEKKTITTVAQVKGVYNMDKITEKALMLALKL